MPPERKQCRCSYGGYDGCVQPQLRRHCASTTLCTLDLCKPSQHIARVVTVRAGDTCRLTPGCRTVHKPSRLAAQAHSQLGAQSDDEERRKRKRAQRQLARDAASGQRPPQKAVQQQQVQRPQAPMRGHDSRHHDGHRPQQQRQHGKQASGLRSWRPPRQQHKQAPSGQQQTVAKRLPLSAWLQQASYVGNPVDVGAQLSVMRDLARVSPQEAQAQRREVSDAVMGVIDVHYRGPGRRCTFADAVGTGLTAHVEVLQSMHGHAGHAEALRGLLNSAAEADETFADDRQIAQVATAQRKLGMYCAAFWQRFQERDVDDVSARTLATLVYCAGVLVNDDVGPAPTAALWDAMQQAMEGEAQNMDSQGIANVFLAHAYLDVQPEAGVHTALCSALRRKQLYIKPQEAANIAWAVGKLRLQLSQPQEQLLLQLLKQHNSGMTTQAVSNTWLGLAHLKLQPNAQLSAALQDAVVATTKEMTSQGVANTLWAFVKLGVSAQDDVVAALLQRALDVSDVMNEQQIANTLYAIAKLRLQVSEALREALLQQAEHVAGGMTAQNVANTLWALAEAQIMPSQAQSSALLERAERVSGGLVAKEVVQVLDGAARLGLRPSESQRSAILAAYMRERPRMTPHQVTITDNALRQLGWMQE